MIAAVYTTLNRSVFTTYNKWVTRICRQFYCAELFKVNLGRIIKILSVFNPNWNTCIRYCQIEKIETFDQAGKLAQTCRPVYSARPQYDSNSFKLEQIKEKATAIYCLKNVKIVGQSNLIHCDKNLSIYESLLSENGINYSFHEPGVLFNKDELFVYSFKKADQTIERGIMLSGNNSDNYYHFMCEVLSRFSLLSSVRLDPEIPLIVDEVVRTSPQFKELLGYFNIENRDIVWIKKGCRYDVKSLYHVTETNFIPNNFYDFSKVKYTDCLFDVDTIKFLRRTMLQNTSSRQFPKRLFLSRRNGTFRRQYNDKEVAALLERYGFLTVHPEQYSVADQIAMFHGADLIVGATGAALTNLIVCRDSCRALCITSRHLDLSIFSTIGKIIGVDLHYYSAGATDVGRNNIHEDFHVDLDCFERHLTEWLDQDKDMPSFGATTNCYKIVSNC